MVAEIDRSGNSGSPNQEGKFVRHGDDTEKLCRTDTRSIENGAKVTIPAPSSNEKGSRNGESAPQQSVQDTLLASVSSLPKNGETTTRASSGTDLRSLPQVTSIKNITPTISTAKGNDSHGNESERDTVDEPRKPLVNTTTHPQSQQTNQPCMEQRPTPVVGAVGAVASRPLLKQGISPSYTQQEKKGPVVDMQGKRNPIPTDCAPSKLAKVGAVQTASPPSSGPTSQFQSPRSIVSGHQDTVSVHDTSIQRLREPLVGKYGLFIHPSDTSLIDARKRLQRALEQTRVLRNAFTDRVYQKYRVVLRPVPTVESTIRRIRQDPVASNARILEEIKEIKEEKEAEKREAQNMSGSGAHGDISNQTSSTETADQLSFIGAGLNLVILPEEDIDSTQIDLHKFTHRGPIDPETGQRVGGISAAAATAAELLLDRVRRAENMRSERRMRKKSPHPVQRSVDTTKQQHDSRHSDLVKLPVASSQARFGNVSQPSSVSVATRLPKRGTPGIGMVASKAGRGKDQSSSYSAASMLSMAPSVEDIIPEGTRTSAATMALLAQGVGMTSALHLHTQRARQPPPPASQLNASTDPLQKRPVSFPSFSNVAGTFNLPPIPSSFNKKPLTPVSVLKSEANISSRAGKALQSVISQFESTQNEDLPAATRPNGQSPNSPQIARRKRKATEIGLLHGLQNSHENGRDVTQPDDLSDEGPIEPVVAFSVLHALGLVRDSPAAKAASTPEKLHHRLSSLDPFQTVARATPSIRERIVRLQKVKGVHNVYRRIVSKKRSFAEAFSARRKLDMETVDKIVNSGSFQGGRNIEQTQLACQEPDIKKARTEADVRQPMSSNEEPVVVLRGGGNEAEDVKAGRDSSGDIETQNSEKQRENIVPAEGSFGDRDEDTRPATPPPDRIAAHSRPSSATSSHGGPHALWADHQHQAFSLLNSRLSSSGSESIFSVMPQTRPGSTSGSFSPARNQTPGGHLQAHQSAAVHHSVGHSLDHFHGPAHQMPIPTLQHAASLNRISVHPAGDLADFFGGSLHHQQSRAASFAGRPEWTALGAPNPAVNLLPTHSSLAALGLTPHNAAMVGLSVRDRATRALLAREQQQNAAAVAHAAAVHRQATAIRSGTAVSGLSPQQAAVLMSTQGHTGQTMFRPSSAGSNGFPHIGAHSAAAAAAILSSPGALMGQAQRAAVTKLNQQSESRPGSQQSASSGKSTKRRPSTSKSSRKDDRLPGVESKPNPNPNRAEKLPERSTKTETLTKDHKHADGQKSIPSSRLKGTKPGKVSQSKLSNTKPQSTQTTRSPATTETKGHSRREQASDSAKKSGKTVMVQERCTHTETIHRGSGQSSTLNAGMQFFTPDVPKPLSAELAVSVLEARIHEAVESLKFSPGNEEAQIASSLLAFVHTVGSSVPIPKALAANPLRERITSQDFKNQTTTTVPREIIVSTILIWLWAQHKSSFERAFSKSGRIDVDPECKWLIQAAVDAACRAVISSFQKEKSNGRNKPGTGSRTLVGTGETEKQTTSSSVVGELNVASVVNQALMTELCIDDTADATLPIFSDLVVFLDEMRMCALRSRCFERALLANLVGRSATMSESFSNAYVSSIVRAGEALGHAELFELVQDEETGSCTMMPYDIFSDETGAWEDPCRNPQGFNDSLSADDLVRRAHARAMIQKSLRKMQERNIIKGGTPHAGAYVDLPARSPRSSAQAASERGSHSHSRPPSSSGRKRAHNQLVSEGSLHGGTGAGHASSISQYNPNHHSAPLFWDKDSIENSPYGRHLSGPRPQPLSRVQLSLSEVRGGGIKGRFPLSSSSPSSALQNKQRMGLVASSEEVDWNDVARVFRSVKTPTKRIQKNPAKRRSSLSATIVAPFCRKFTKLPEDTSESNQVHEETEDLSDESMLARHQIVLDEMKKKLDKFMDARPGAGPRGRKKTVNTK